jgi:hypothetical protein
MGNKTDPTRIRDGYSPVASIGDLVAVSTIRRRIDEVTAMYRA